MPSISKPQENVAQQVEQRAGNAFHTRKTPNYSGGYMSTTPVAWQLPVTGVVGMAGEKLATQSPESCGPFSRIAVKAEGLEPSTYGLKVRCSTD